MTLQSFVPLMDNEIKPINQMQEKNIRDCKGISLISNVSDSVVSKLQRP